LKHCKPFVLQNDIIQIYQTSSISIKMNRRKRHRFTLDDNDNDKKQVSSITVSVVCHGVFDNEGEYDPAHISVSFHKLQQNGAPSVCLGYAPYDLQIINTERRLGRIIIKYDCEENYTTQSTKNEFEIVIHAQSSCQYSIDVSCKATYDANDILINELYTYFDSKKQMKQYETLAENATLDDRLAKRKISLLKELIKKSEMQRKKCEKDIDSKELELDLDAKIDYRSGKEEIKV
jgi:hypothetical protein